MKIEKISPAEAAKKFQYLQFNRPVNIRAVKALEHSVMRHGILRPVVLLSTSVIENKRGWYIGDGQHLFNALLRLEMPIPYIVKKCETMDEVYHTVIELNTTAQSWQTADYVRLWASSGRRSYITLRDLQFETGFTYSQLACVMNGKRRNVADIRDGSYRVYKSDYGRMILGELEELKEVMSIDTDIAMGYYNFRKDKALDYSLNNMKAKVTHRGDLIAPRPGRSSPQYWMEVFNKLNDA